MDPVRDPSELDAARRESERRKALLERAEQLAEIGSWAWTPETGEVIWSDNHFRLMGLEPGEVTPSVGFLLDRMHPDDRARVGREIEAARMVGELPPIEMRIVRADGSVRHLHATGGVEDVAPGRPRTLIGSIRDVTDRRRVEREIAAHLAVSEALAAWTSLDSGAVRLLRDLGGALGATVGMLWLPEADDALVRRVFWSEPSVDARELERRTRDLRLARGAGLPGRAWEGRTPMALDDQGRSERFTRPAAPEREDLPAALAVPALHGTEVLAVVELYSREDDEIPERLMRSLIGVGYELGGFLARRRGELKPVPLTPRELEVLQLAAQGLSGPEIAGLLVLSPATVKSHLEHVRTKLGVSDRASAVAYALREGLID
jgi:PAS domain S-box-containing protein